MILIKVTAVCFWALLVGMSAAIGTLAVAPQALAAPALNSSEPGCDGSDPNVLMCEDFDDGVWYSQHCDAQGHPTASNPTPSNSKGWCGTIYASPITPANAAVCGGAGFGGTNCAATSGSLTGGVGGRNMADHAFVNFQGVSEIYVRWYYWASAGYQWSQQKALTFNSGNPGDGGIKFGNFSFRCAAGDGLSSTANITMGFPVPQDECANPNVSDISVTGGKWYFVEAHMSLGTPGQSNGKFRLWMNDCGAAGVCTGTPTLRMDRSNIRYNRTSTSELIRTLWWENWGNSTTGQGSIGTEKYDQIKVSKVGPIGFMGAAPTNTVSPSAPFNVRTTP